MSCKHVTTGFPSTHQTPPRRFGTLFFEVLPFTDDASAVNGKTSKKSMQKRSGGFWRAKALRVAHGQLNKCISLPI